jgi:hypothetical protein
MHKRYLSNYTKFQKQFKKITIENKKRTRDENQGEGDNKVPPVTRY